MTATEAAEKWGMSVATLCYHLTKGHVPTAFKEDSSGRGAPRWFIPDDAERPKPYACCHQKKKREKPEIIQIPQSSLVTPEQEEYIRIHAIDKTYREICEATGLSLSEARKCYDHLHALYGC